MKEIPDIDIKAAFEQAIAETKEARTRGVASAIKNLMMKAANVELQLARAKHDVDRFEKELAGYNGAIERIKKGDWSALPEVKEEKPQEEPKPRVAT